MKKTLALAALLAATAFTPAFAQEEPRQERRMAEGATAEEPTPVPERVQARMAQEERREPVTRGDAGGRIEGGAGQGRPAEGGEQPRPEGGWQSRGPATPVYQPSSPVAPTPSAMPATPPTDRRWSGNRDMGNDSVFNTGGANGGGVNGGGTNGGGRPEWSRPTPPVVVVPAQPQNGESRRDTWRSDGRNDGRNNNGWNRPDQTRNNGWHNDGRWNDQHRNDTWRSDGWRNDGRWSDHRRNDTWRNDTWRNDSWRNNNRYDQRNTWQNQYRDWNRNWSRDWRRDQRYDWQRYRYSNRNLFQNNRYYAPYGWSYGYRRFTVGFSLSYVLYDQQYWIDDPYSYRLPPVYGPYRWVRYYDDVLLVDLRSGQVVDAIYDFFW